MVPTPMPNSRRSAALEHGRSVDREPHGHPRVVGQQADEQNRDVEEVAMDVLDDEREPAFAEVLLPGFTHGAPGRVGPERLVVCPSVVIAGESEPDRAPENQRGRREVQERRPPGRLGRSAEPGVRGRPEQERRVHRREVRAPLVVRVRIPRPRRVDDEGGESEKREGRRHPPRVSPGCFAKSSLSRQGGRHNPKTIS